PSKMWSYTLLSLFIWTLMGLVAATPTEISAIEDAAEDNVPHNFNVSEGSIIPQPRFAQVNINGKTYTIHFDEVNWFTALEFCSYYGQILASITSIDDNEQLFKTLDQYGLSYSSFFWLGGSDLGHYGQWVWVSNGESVEHFTKWRQGEPNNVYGNEHCIELLSDGQWNDNNCNLKRKFICENR
ncbi:hypothetical protein DOY81_005147, partial [Sarcophaga bullata]